MQITLNQAEIEQAIKNYVNDQVNIREGHDITIDLKAGRGPEGFTATIDIVAPGAAKAPEPTTGSNKPMQARPVRLDRAVTQPVSTQSQPTQDAPETAQEAAGEAVAETATEVQAEPETAATGQDGGEASNPEGEEEAAAPPDTAEKPKSLFANLSKPRN